MNGVGPGGSPADTDFGPDFVVAVKVESEFLHKSSSFDKDSIVKVKVESEFEDDSTSQEKGEAQVVKSEAFQNNLPLASQDALSNDHVKQEVCDSLPTGPSKAAKLFEDFIVAVKVESEFLDQSSSLDKDEAQVVKSQTFPNDLLHTSQDALSNDHVKQETCDSPPTEPSEAAELLEEKQMNLVSCSNCSQLLNTHVFNHRMTQTVTQETGAFSTVSCKRCTEIPKNIQGSLRPHKCSVCSKSYAFISGLKIHQRLHTERNYSSVLFAARSLFAHQICTFILSNTHTRDPIKRGHCKESIVSGRGAQAQKGKVTIVDRGFSSQ
uniref:C2H2-type domain-containing protein n=1 Tax=Eptatretus burgeri TaxID=7764 RepID=A0A8C4QFJ2_EPTBU